jgi:hypothetical protein
MVRQVRDDMLKRFTFHPPIQTILSLQNARKRSSLSMSPSASSAYVSNQSVGA